MTRAAWLESRSSALGGSDVGQIPSIVAACGGDPETDCAPWASEWRVWASKVLDVEEQAESADMAVGNWLEPAIIEWAAEALGGEPIDSPATFERGVLSGSPDGWIQRASPGLLEGVEAKVSADWQPWERPPFYYLLQCRTYLICTDAPRWHLACYFRRANVRRLYTIERDPEAERLLSEAAAAWWDLRVAQRVEPEISGDPACARTLERLHPRETGASFGDFRVASDQEVAIATEAHRLDVLHRAIGRDVDALKNELRSAIGDGPGLRWTGGSVRWSRNKIAIKLENVT